MALADEVTNRVPTQRLVELTNPNTPSATSTDTTVLGYAVTDAQADFEIFAGVEYDNSEATHVRVGIEGVLFHLHRYKLPPGHPQLNMMTQQYEQSLKRLALITGRNRVMPTTTSKLTPSDEQRNAGDTVRPTFDNDRWGSLEPWPPLHFGNVNQVPRENTNP